MDFKKRAVPDKGSLFSGTGKTSFHEKRGLSLPRTPTLFKKSGIFSSVLLNSSEDKFLLFTNLCWEQSLKKKKSSLQTVFVTPPGRFSGK